ncbi:hypothetical protein [Marinomonas atlantica]|uniref:hypothetical protein n=1 Tax=Marinomonas atlantica TaxID=1806668 RepID=UPI00082DB34C|nr:hypothetical protein [Marinomonas atlantica]
MPRSLRYYQADIQDHLASQYILGTLSPLCRRRTESLARQIPELEARIYHWQQRMAPIHNHTDSLEPPKRVWQALAKEVGLKPYKSSRLQRLWQSALPWRLSTAVACLLLVAMLFNPPNQQNITALQSASYMASLHPILPTESGSQAEPQMVLLAYQGNEAKPSQLRLQWNQRTTKTDTQGLYIWASSRDTGQLILLGKLSDLKNGRDLSKPEWAAIKNSAELLVIDGQTREDNVRFRGVCVQLNTWSVTEAKNISL